MITHAATINEFVETAPDLTDEERAYAEALALFLSWEPEDLLPIDEEEIGISHAG